MGCASSKKNSICGHCGAPYSPMTRRSFSMIVHHPRVRKGDSYHVVALTSSTFGSIKLDPPLNLDDDDDDDDNNDDEWNDENRKINEVGIDEKEEFVMGMIDENIHRVCPKTPIRTPPGEPEYINVEELMEGLEDYSPPSTSRLKDNHTRSFSFHVTITDSIQKDGLRSPKYQAWFDPEERENVNLISEFDPTIISAFRKALQELSPTNLFHIKPNDPNQEEQNVNEIFDVKVTETNSSKITPIEETEEETTKERVVLYFTSLHAVRKTFQDCLYVRLILEELGVRVDKRDVSMHLGFKEELRERLGDGFKAQLPKVFIGERYIGGVEEIRRMHEDGQLKKVTRACEMMEDESGNRTDVCKACHDKRFFPCEACSGSCKIFYKYDEDNEEFEEQDECGFQKCPDCNENGLVRCPICRF